MNKPEEITFIVNARGEKTHAVMPIASYRRLLQIQAFLEEPGTRLGSGHELYYLRMRNREFRGILEACGYPIGQKTHPRFIIARSSQAKFYAVSSLSEQIARLRESLIEDRTIVLDPAKNCFSFTRDYETTSPSLAAALVSGSVKSGLEVWVNMHGFSLRQSGYGARSRTARRSRSKA